MLNINQSLLIVIDVQGKLAGMMHDHSYLRHVQGMIKAAQILDIPIILTEQAPEKIGATIEAVSSMTSGIRPIGKQTFSCWGEIDFVKTLKESRRKQIIVTGIETHVCVYQTVRDLLSEQYEVHLVTDAVSSRSAINRDIGIRRCGKEGAVLTTVEMSITELIRSTAHPKFREIMQLLKDNK